MDTPKLYTPKETAEKLGIRQRTLQMLRRRGRIEGIAVTKSMTIYTEEQIANADLRSWEAMQADKEIVRRMAEWEALKVEVMGNPALAAELPHIINADADEMRCYFERTIRDRVKEPKITDVLNGFYRKD